MPLEISSFTVVPDHCDGPTTVTVQWTVEDATAVVLSDVGTVAAQGSKPFDVEETTTFVLTAFDAHARRVVCGDCTVTVAVDPERTPVPKGLIVPWWSATDEPPAGWAICDGENGTPDLQGRFIRGAGPAGPRVGAFDDADPHRHELPVASETPVGETDDAGAHRHHGANGWSAVSVKRGKERRAAVVGSDAEAKWEEAGGHVHPVYVTAPARVASVDVADEPPPRPAWHALHYLMKL